MNASSEREQEFLVGAVGVLLSLGLLKANEIFDFFSGLDLFEPAGLVLKVHGLELIAVIVLVASYILFLVLSLFAVLPNFEDSNQHGAPRPLEKVSTIVVVLAVMQFMSMATGFTHAMHKYQDVADSGGKVEWVFGFRSHTP